MSYIHFDRLTLSFEINFPWLAWHVNLKHNLYVIELDELWLLHLNRLTFNFKITATHLLELDEFEL